MSDNDQSEIDCPKSGCRRHRGCSRKGGCGGNGGGPSLEKVVSEALDGFVKKHEEIEEKRENANRTLEKIEDVDKKEQDAEQKEKKK